jgi:hypothetical protein
LVLVLKLNLLVFIVNEIMIAFYGIESSSSTDFGSFDKLSYRSASKPAKLTDKKLALVALGLRWLR